ncbi:MAG: hypothetical protein O2855_04855 [Planctomycetota bacterium]|nr:hypothetical protein [Planctomycetota bacterium]
MSVGVPGESSVSPQSPASPQSREPRFALPAVSVGVALALLGGALVLAWDWIGPALGYSVEEVSMGRRGVIGVSVAMVAVWLLICPWKIRCAGDWMAWWLGAIVVRLFGLPILVYLLHSPPPKSPNALVAAAAGAALVLLLAEAGLTARSVGWHFDRQTIPTP